ncbi:hypothetical protein SDC9_175735 [bioreactor metagenome]|uniref:Uncharacterized protein n=1 Tax=bioreactor metagenome TaxID=1076179 RepID=A0A645GW88_9ZZZZ|nr:hypothetical protein [Oscillospiraceae bacterium]
MLSHCVTCTTISATTAPDNIEWIKKLIVKITPQIKDKKKCNSGALWYYWLCLSELPFEIAKPEIEKYKSEILNWLTNKSCVMNSEHDKTIHPVLLCILRNTLSQYPEYAYIRKRMPYVNDKDGRLYFDMSKES